MCVIQSKFTKQTRIFFKTGGGGAPGAPGLDPPLVSQSLECLKVLPLLCLSRSSCTEAVGVPLLHVSVFTKHQMLTEIFISAPC